MDRELYPGAFFQLYVSKRFILFTPDLKVALDMLVSVLVPWY
jgi:hypothetical protein